MNVRILDVISLGCLRVRVNVRMHVCIFVRVCQDVLRVAYCVRACVRVRVPAQSADTRPTTPQRRLRTSLYKVVTRIERSTLSQALEKWSVRSHLFARLRRVVKGVIL